MSINDVKLKEGNSGTTAFVFTVALSGIPMSTVTVDFGTADGSATVSDADYVPTLLGTVTFPAGTNLQTVTVLVNGDLKREANELFYVNLSNPSPNADLGDAQGIGTIVNDD